MRITISKILNRTDLAQSGSHGGLVVTRTAKQQLLDFFEHAGIEQEFLDETDGEMYPIHYVDYTANGTTPNDRITPIGKYAKKHDLKAGDNLIFEKSDEYGSTRFFIRHVRKKSVIYFVGKSRTTAEVLDYAEFLQTMHENVLEGNIDRRSRTSWKLMVKYQGVFGQLLLNRVGEKFELLFDGEHIEENKKYFELDVAAEPFELRKMDTWKVEIDVDSVSVSINGAADERLLWEMAELDFDDYGDAYVASPQDKKPGRAVGGRMVPDRDRNSSALALARAGYLCEYNRSHELFLRRRQPVNYTEPHHLIPLQYDALFEKSLDVPANIVSLCSHCHNLIHYGADAEVIIRRLWHDRRKELAAAGIGTMKNGVELTVETLLGFYGIK